MSEYNDQLEEFIRRNRGSFDDREPGSKVWKGIEDSLPAPKRSLWSSVVLWRAAAMLFMGLSLYLFLANRIGTKQTSNEVALKEFHDIESFYVQEIAEKVQLIDQFQDHDGNLSGFTQDFRQLEAMYVVLKEEMKAHPSRKVKDALILNLLVRIDLLNQQLHQLDRPEEDTNYEVRGTKNS